jgi:hypothetical protein
VVRVVRRAETLAAIVRRTLRDAADSVRRALQGSEVEGSLRDELEDEGADEDLRHASDPEAVFGRQRLPSLDIGDARSSREVRADRDRARQPFRDQCLQPLLVHRRSVSARHSARRPALLESGKFAAS